MGEGTRSGAGPVPHRPMTELRCAGRKRIPVRPAPVFLIAALLMVLGAPGRAGASSTAVDVIPAPDPVARSVAVGTWHLLTPGDWSFQPSEPITHLEIAIYDGATTLERGSGPFLFSTRRNSGPGVDGPEDASGNLGCESTPGVLCDSNQKLFGKPHYESLRLFGGSLSVGSGYSLGFSGPVPSRVWIHPIRPDYFTMSTSVLQSGEAKLQAAAYGPATVIRVLSGSETRFVYSGLTDQSATGVKDDYPVQSYGQRPGSHGNGDFGWFSGYSLRFTNEGPDPIRVNLFMNTGFTGVSGNPTSTLANDTFWKGSEIYLTSGNSGLAWLDFDDVTGWTLSDNPVPHTGGGESWPEGTPGIAINVFDRLQVSAIGWEVRLARAGTGSATLLVAPEASDRYAVPPVQVGIGADPGSRAPGFSPPQPNPFHTTTRIPFALPGPAPARAVIRVFDPAGRLVRVLLDEVISPGPGSVSWDGRGDDAKPLAAGVYYLRMDVIGRPAARRAVILLD